MNADTEGVIKYALDFQTGPAPSQQSIALLDAWRTVLHDLALVGQTANRYDGYGFGNVSARQGTGFAISGTQTGKPRILGADGYSLVTQVEISANAVTAQGAVKPSSESLTHGAVYALCENIGAVFHAHAPDIWSAAMDGRLAIPATAANVPYGTPQMAEAVAQMYREQSWKDLGLFVMAGHEDGVVAFGPTCESAGAMLVSALAQANAAQRNSN